VANMASVMLRSGMPVCGTIVKARSADAHFRGAVPQFGQLGVGKGEDRQVPVAVASLAEEPITLAACGWRHTTVVSVLGNVYSWGRGCCGQLGHGDLDDLCAAAAGLSSLFPADMQPPSDPSQAPLPNYENPGPAHSLPQSLRSPLMLSGASLMDSDVMPPGEQ